MPIRKRVWTTNNGERSERWIADVVDANGNRERRQFDSRDEADAYRITIEGQIQAGTFRAGAAKTTIKEAAEDFLRRCELRQQTGERMTLRNLRTMEGHVWNYICPDPGRHDGKRRHAKLVQFRAGVGGVRLSQLTRGGVVEFRDRLRAAGVGVVTTRKILSTLQQILRHAQSHDLVAHNAAQGVEVIGRRGERARRIVPPAKDILRALLELADPDFRVQLAFAAATGVRAGELHALRWHHIDMVNCEVTIETRVDAYCEEDVTKTAAGMRTIPLGEPLIIMLKEWKLRSSRKKPEDLVFPNKRGWYTEHGNMVKRKFYPLFDRLAQLHEAKPDDFPAARRFNWHALRHFAISCWIEANLSPKTIQTFAGHSSLQVTMDRYGHLFRSDDHRRTMDAIASGLF